MEVKINSKTVEVASGITLAEALIANNIATKGIAVAVNETVIPKNCYDKHNLHQGDEIIIIKAFYGG